MSTISHEPSEVVRGKQRWSLQLPAPEMWASLAIIVMWLAVLFDAVFGPDIVNTSAGGDRSTVPSAVVVALSLSLLHGSSQGTASGATEE